MPVGVEGVAAQRLPQPLQAGPGVSGGQFAAIGVDGESLRNHGSTAVGGGATADTLAELHALGVGIALDDFGTGQSTLTLLATCPIDQIKLDRSFVPDGASNVIASAVLQLARGLGVETIAEGVETTTQAQCLLALGHDRAQGCHFARPVPADALNAMMSLDERIAHHETV